jgi:hypothetical protein
MKKIFQTETDSLSGEQHKVSWHLFGTSQLKITEVDWQFATDFCLVCFSQLAVNSTSKIKKRF